MIKAGLSITKNSQISKFLRYRMMNEPLEGDQIRTVCYLKMETLVFSNSNSYLLTPMTNAVGYLVKS